MAGLNPARVAMPYTYDRSIGDFDPYGHYGFPDYPSGQLRTSVSQLASFLLAFINNGEANGTRILTLDTIGKIMTVQYPRLNETQGLGWYSMTLGGTELWGHSGGEQGAAAEMFFRQEDGVGVIMFTNAELETDEAEQAWEEIFRRLFQEAAGY